MATQLKSVSFGSIEIVQINFSIGDNPSVTSGSVPISLEWDAHTTTNLPLDYFEQIRPPRHPKVRRFSPRTRERILLRMGYSRQEIQKATLAAEAKKQERALTLHQLHKMGQFKKTATREEKLEDMAATIPQRRPLPTTRKAMVPKAA